MYGIVCQDGYMDNTGEHSGIVITDRRGTPIEARETSPAEPRQASTGMMIRGTRSRVPMNEQLALTISTVWRCCEVLSNAIAMMPTQIREWSDGQQRTVENDYSEFLLEQMANRELTGRQLKVTLTTHLLLWGNGIAEIERETDDGSASGIYPIEPERHKGVERDANGDLVYVVSNPDGSETRLDPDNVFHIKGLSYDGLWGYSRVRMARESLSLSRAAELYGASYFGNSGTPSGVLESEEDLEDEDIELLKQTWRQEFGGVDAAGKVAILLPGQKFKPITMPPGDLQFLDTRNFQVQDIGPRWFGVPNAFLGDQSKSTLNNMEQMLLHLLTFGAAPLAGEWESQIRKLWSIDQREKRLRTAKLDTKGLLRADVKARTDFYRHMREAGVFSANDIRKLEDLEPIGAAGDIRIAPMNYQNLEDLMRPMEERRNGGRRNQSKAVEKPNAEGMIPTEALDDVARRVTRRAANAWQNKRKAVREDHEAWVAEFAAAGVSWAMDVARPVCRTLVATICRIRTPGAQQEQVLDTGLSGWARAHAERLENELLCWGIESVDEGLDIERARLTEGLMELIQWAVRVGPDPAAGDQE